MIKIHCYEYVGHIENFSVVQMICNISAAFLSLLILVDNCLQIHKG